MCESFCEHEGLRSIPAAGTTIMASRLHVVVSMPALRMQNGYFAGASLVYRMTQGDVTVEMPGGTKVSVEKRKI